MQARNLWAKAGLLTAMAICTATAQAQAPVGLKDTPATAPDDVVVKAQPDPTTEQVEHQAKAITRMTDFYTEPMARFEDRVCPGVLGLPVETASLMVGRIRSDAERVGAPLAPENDCKPNIIVAFVRDGAEAVPKLMKSSGFIFSKLEASEQKEIQDEAGVVRAWHATVLRTRHGEAETPGLKQGPVSFHGNMTPGLPPLPTTTEIGSDSHIFSASRHDIAYAIVVIDIKAINGMSVAQIADYAAMRALARTRPASADAAATTILSLFAPNGRQTFELTSFDLGYLRSLYAAGSNLPASAKLGGVSRAMRKEELAMAKGKTLEN